MLRHNMQTHNIRTIRNADGVRVVSDLGTSCFGYELFWVRVVLGTDCLGYGLSWVRIVLLPQRHLSNVVKLGVVGFDISFYNWNYCSKSNHEKTEST